MRMDMIFKTEIIAVGVEAQSMLDESQLFILFSGDAPQDLADYCFMISNKELDGHILPSCKLVIDEVAYPITAVGAVVEKNLAELGHITISLSGENEATLPGTLYIQADKKPVLTQGTTLQILAPEE